MIYIVLILLGLCFGSFANAVVWRIHKQENNKTKSEKYSITKGRSMCPNCKHSLSAVDLIPIVSWVSLGGKCRYCKKPILWQYPIVEFITALLFIISYNYWPYDFGAIGITQFIFWLVFLVSFAILSIYDFKWMILPNRLVYPLIILAIIYVLCISILSGSVDPVLSGFFGVIFSSGLFYLIFQLSDGKWIGGGDVKLAIVLGLLIGGPLNSLLMLFIASLVGSLVSIPLVISGSSLKKKIPFGPFLIIATIIVYLFGVSIIGWYQTKVLYL